VKLSSAKGLSPRSTPVYVENGPCSLFCPIEEVFSSQAESAKFGAPGYRVAEKVRFLTSGVRFPAHQRQANGSIGFSIAGFSCKVGRIDTFSPRSEGIFLETHGPDTQPQCF
jgi:hypothetical protein